MFKRLMIGLVAVGLVVLFIAEAANALSIRRRNTVENFHKCLQLLPDGTRDPCYGATAVTDTLYGVLGADAFCRMTGMVVCQLPEGGICTDTSNETILTLDSFVAGASFVTETRSAVDLTVLPLAEGQDVCDDAFAEGTTIFDRFWPTVTVAHTVYEGVFTNIPTILNDNSEAPTEYVLIELCVAQTGSDLYLCETLWDSVYGDNGIPGIEDEPMPHLPCCGEVNSLNVVIEGKGTVISDPADIIDCTNNTGECSAEYDGFVYPYDGCPEPEIRLTATAADGWEFIGWSGGSCTGTGACTVTAEEGYGSVTAEFWSVLTVEVVGQGTVTSDPGDISCETGDVGVCSETYDPDTTTVTLSASTDLGYVVEWTGCNSYSDGDCLVTPPANVTATYAIADGFIKVVVDKGIVDGAKVWIKQPQKANFSYPLPASDYCTGVCFIDTSELPFKGDETELILKRAGGEYNTWIGLGDTCSEGYNNSLTTCTIQTNPLLIQEIIAQWAQVAE